MYINLDERYSYNKLLDASIRLKNNFPSLISIYTIGLSHDKRDIFMIKLGKGISGPVISSGVHGRENINPIVSLGIIETYANKYYGKGLRLLNDYAIFFIPLINPDGYSISLEGYNSLNNSSLKNICENTGITSSEYKYNARGIDINRNFLSKTFYKSKTSGTPLSENESVAFVNCCKNHNTLGLIDFHSRGKSIYYYRNVMDNSYNQTQFDLAVTLAKKTKYTLNLPHTEHEDKFSGGNTVNYYSECINKPAITIETIEDEATFPLDVGYQSEVYKEIREIPLEYLKALLTNT